MRKQAQPLTVEQEDRLWTSGVFNLNSGWGLTYAVFWYNCKLFGLRGGDEHRALRREQFEVGSDGNGRFIRFMGRSCKNVQGGLRQRKVQCKDLRIYARPELGDRCVVDLYNHYFSFIPITGDFYRKPIGDSPPKFSKQVIGKNKLGTLVKEMCLRAGFSGNYTNHSGKVTCATQLFENNIDEQLIMRQTGHCSRAVRNYKRPGVQHDQLVSSVLQPPAKSVKREPLSECWMPPPQNFTLPQYTQHLPPQPVCQSECWMPPPQPVSQSECWKPPPQPVSQKENRFTLPGGVVLNFHFGN